MSQVTHENAIVPSDALTAVEGAADMADATEMDKSMGEKILHILDSRAENGASDVVIVVDEWAYADWSDYEITSQPVLVVGHVEDYSEKAYKLTSAFEAQVDVMDGKSLEEVQETYITSLLQQVDETDEDFHDDKGEMFLPKSAVSAILVRDE
jgi:hypothetical protein